MFLNTGEAAIHFAHPRAHFACGALWVLADALPILAFFCFHIQMRWLLVQQHSGYEIGGDGPAHCDGAHHEAQSNPESVDAGIVGDARTYAEQFGILLIAIERCARRVHVYIRFNWA